MVHLNVAIVAVVLPGSTILAYPTTVFLRRQVGDSVPEQCASECDGLARALQCDPNCATNLSCFCSSLVENSLQACVPCIYRVSPRTLPDGPAATLQRYNAACGVTSNSMNGGSSDVVSSTVSSSASVGSASSTVPQMASAGVASFQKNILAVFAIAVLAAMTVL